MENYLLKGLVVGLIFGVPAGAIGALTIQRAMQRGFVAGLITGFGSSIADVLYACVGVFGITLISNFLESNQQMIKLIGGFLLITIAIPIFFSKRKQPEDDKTNSRFVLYFLSSFSVAILNPATVLSFVVAFSSFGIFGQLNLQHGAQLIIGILVSTVLWWAMLSGLVCFFRNRINDSIYQWLNYILATGLAAFGLIVIIQSLLQ
nr:LysE family transporter [uncultured Carboxylicivirga sp.]